MRLCLTPKWQHCRCHRASCSCSAWLERCSWATKLCYWTRSQARWTAQRKKKLRVLLRNGMQDRTVILISHRVEMFKECDLVIKMDAGTVIELEETPGGD